MSNQSLASIVLPYLAGTGTVAGDAVVVSILLARKRLTPDQLASQLGVSRRLLSKHLEANQLPPPHKMLTWGRLVVAAGMLRKGVRSADSVAEELGFPSGNAFRNTCQRYLGCTPHQIITHGGGEWVFGQMIASSATHDDIYADEIDFG